MTASPLVNEGMQAHMISVIDGLQVVSWTAMEITVFWCILLAVILMIAGGMYVLIRRNGTPWRTAGAVSVMLASVPLFVVIATHSVGSHAPQKPYGDALSTSTSGTVSVPEKMISEDILTAGGTIPVPSRSNSKSTCAIGQKDGSYAKRHFDFSRMRMVITGEVAVQCEKRTVDTSSKPSPTKSTPRPAQSLPRPGITPRPAPRR